MVGGRGLHRRSLSWHLAHQFARTVTVLIGASFLLYAVATLAPSGDGAALRIGSPETSAEKINAETFSLSSYLSWLAGAATGDFGRSLYIQQGRPISELVWPAAGRSLKLALASVVIGVVVGLGCAILRHLKPLSKGPKGLSLGLGLVSAVPIFLYAYLAVYLGNRLLLWGDTSGWWVLPGWFPFPRVDSLLPWIIGAAILAVGDGGLVDLYRRIRGELAQAARAPHLGGARLLGLSVPKLLARSMVAGGAHHMAHRLSFALGSLVVLESALGWPGLGYLAWRAAGERDLPLLLAAALVSALLIRVGFGLAELAGLVADPRMSGE